MRALTETEVQDKLEMAAYYKSFYNHQNGRCSGLMVSALVSRLSPGWGHYVLGQDTLLSQCLSPPRCINGLC